MAGICFAFHMFLSYLYTKIFHSFFATLKPVVTYTVIKSTALHGLFQDPSCGQVYAEGRLEFLFGCLNVRL